MKKHLIALTAIFCLLAFSCRKNNSSSDNNSATVINFGINNGNDYSGLIDKLIVERPVINADGEIGSYIPLSEAAYEDGQISIVLPETVAVGQENIVQLGFELNDGETLLENTLQVSDADAKWFFLVFNGYKSSQHVAAIYNETEVGNKAYTKNYVYADRDFSISGKFIVKDESGDIYETSADITLKKGWNILYDIYTVEEGRETDILSLVAPTGITFDWQVYYWGDGASLKNLNAKPKYRSHSNLFPNLLGRAVHAQNYNSVFSQFIVS